MKVIGIDPGLNGGIAIIKDGILRVCITMPTMKKPNGKGNQLNIQVIRGLLDETATVYLERQQAMPGQGVVSMFSIGHGQGALEGLCVGMRIKHQIVPPREWQKAMLAGVSKGDTKAASAVIAQRMYPDHDFRATVRCKNIHDGKTDAALIATYGWRMMNGESK